MSDLTTSLTENHMMCFSLLNWDIGLHVFKHFSCSWVAILLSCCKWLQIGEKRVAAAAQKGNTYSLRLLFGGKKASWKWWIIDEHRWNIIEEKNKNPAVTLQDENRLWIVQAISHPVPQRHTPLNFLVVNKILFYQHLISHSPPLFPPPSFYCAVETHLFWFNFVGLGYVIVKL